MHKTTFAEIGQSEAAGGPQAFCAVQGPFRLKLRDGKDITPKSQLRQALLAVLATAPDQNKSRRVLQTMFWGGASAKKASANLRSAVYMLKQDLSPIGPVVLLATANSISLSHGLIQVAPGSVGGHRFLEGIDPNLKDCGGFEEWLLFERQSQYPTPSRSTFPTPALQDQSPQAALGIVPVVSADLSHEDSFFVDTAMRQIIQAISAVSSIPIHDLRNSDQNAETLPIETGSGPSHLLQAVVTRNGAALRIQLRLLTAWSKHQIWISDPLDLRANSLELSALPEGLISALVQARVEKGVPDLFPWTALTALFSLEPSVIRRTENQVNRMLDHGGPEILRCLSIFAQVFRENEGVGPSPTITSEDLCNLLDTVDVSDPMRPLWESLGGYTAHMLMGKNDLAMLLLRSAQNRAPHLSLNLDHLAVVSLALGDLDGAERAQQLCQHVGKYSPWRYTYEVTGAMIAMARGNHRLALEQANKSLMHKPKFVGGLRYAMAGFALSGNGTDARRMQMRIHQLRPDYDLESWTQNMILRSPAGLGHTMANGFEESGLF